MAKPQTVQVKTLDLRWPSGGLDRSYSYQRQSPYTTYASVNCRPTETLDRRERGGSRPGLGKAFYELLGSGAPVRLLNQVTYVQNDGLQYFTEDFAGSSLGSAWATGSWIGAFPTLVGDSFTAATAADAEVGGVKSVFSPALSTSSDYWMEMYVVPYQAAHNGEYAFWFRMDDATPAGLTNGVVARLTLTGTGAYSGSIKVYVAGVNTESYTFSTGTSTFAEAGWFRVKVSTNTVSCYWQGTLLKSQLLTAGAAGKRIAFSMKSTVAAAPVLIDTLRIQYYITSNPNPYHSLLVAGSNGQLYKESLLGQMASIGGTLKIGTDRQIASAERAQKLYIADDGFPAQAGTDGVRGTGNTKLDAASVSDWTANGATAADYVVVISAATGGGINNTYLISSIASGEITLSTAWCTTPGDTCTYRLVRAPKIYDPITNALTIWTATTGKGTVPSECPLIMLYRDRLWLGGSRAAPHLWYASRQGDPLDWDYSAQDAGAAIAGQNSAAGAIGEPLTAFIPFSDDYAVMGCRDSLWMVRGDPAFGGSIHSVSRAVGIVSRTGFAKGPNGEIVFLSRDGLYYMAPGGAVQSLSREKCPKELLNVDATINTVSLAYDPDFRGVHLYIVSELAAKQIHWWLDWSAKGFWQATLQDSHEPTSIHYFQATDAKDSALLLGGRDGYLRKYSNECEVDDGSAIASYVYYGPLMAASAGFDGLITRIRAVLAIGSGPVAYAIQAGTSAQAAVTATARETGTFSYEGLNYHHRPRSRGPGIVIKLSNASNNRRWAIDSLLADMVQVGELTKT